MVKIAVVLLADTGTPEGTARMANALVAARELAEAGHEVRFFFDGAGTRWVPELEKPDHCYHGHYEELERRGAIAGACGYCAGAFGVKPNVQECGVPLVDEYLGHPSFARLVAEGFQILTF